MTETRQKYSLVEQEYTTFIRGLIDSAVAAPMESYRQATVAELARSATALIEAREALGRYLEQSGERLKSQFAPLLDAVDELNFKVDAISARMPEAASSNGLHDTLANIGERLKAIETDFASGLTTLKSETAGDPRPQRDGADTPAKLRTDVQPLLRQLEGSVAGVARTLSDIPRQLTAQHAASEEIGRRLAELHARLDEQVRLLVSELKQSGQGVAGATHSVIKETEARLDGRLAELGAAVMSSAEGVGKEFTPLHDRLGKLNSLAAQQQGRLGELAARVETFQSEAAAGVNATLSGLIQTEQSLGLLISGNIESAVARVTEGQADASRKILERTGAVGAEVKERAELLGLKIEETRKSIGAATTDSRAQLSEQITQTTDALRAWLSELAGQTIQTREQLDLLRQTIVKEGASVASSLKASDENTNQRLQRLAAEFTKTFGGWFDKQTEEANSNATRLQVVLHHVTDLKRAVGASTDALRKGLNNSMEVSRTIAREGSDTRTALEIRIDRAIVEQQNLKRFVVILFGFTAFSSVGIIAILLYLLFRTLN